MDENLAGVEQSPAPESPVESGPVQFGGGEEQEQSNDSPISFDVESRDPVDDSTEEAPEHYRFEIPDDFDLDDDATSDLSRMLRTYDLSDEDAQKVMDYHVNELARLEKGREAAQGEMTRAWQERVRRDPEIGGPKLNANLSHANKLISKYGSPEFISFMRETGLQNNPEFLRFVVRAGKALTEDSFVSGSSAGGSTPKTMSEMGKLLFPNTLGGNE